MLNRLAAVMIVAFWVVMWGLLLRSEFEPEEGVLRDVPVEHVLKLMFHHQQPSELTLYSDRTMIGRLRLFPKVEEDGDRLLEFSGDLRLHVPSAERQRLTWEGESTFTDMLDLKQLSLDVTLHSATASDTASRFAFEFDAATKKGRYEMRNGTMIFDKQEFEATEAGIRKVVDRLGMDTSLTQSMTPSKGSAPPEVRARRATFTTRGGEEMETLLLTVMYNQQTVLQVHVTQLGRVLYAKTILGWTLELD